MRKFRWSTLNFGKAPWTSRKFPDFRRSYLNYEVDPRASRKFHQLRSFLNLEEVFFLYFGIVPWSSRILPVFQGSSLTFGGVFWSLGKILKVQGTYPNFRMFCEFLGSSWALQFAEVSRKCTKLSKYPELSVNSLNYSEVPWSSSNCLKVYWISHKFPERLVNHLHFSNVPKQFPELLGSFLNLSEILWTSGSYAFWSSLNFKEASWFSWMLSEYFGSSLIYSEVLWTCRKFLIHLEK